jgi:hypothetical protein
MNRLCHTSRRSAKAKQLPSLIRIAMESARVIPVGKADTIRVITTDAVSAQRSNSPAKYFVNRRRLGVMTAFWDRKTLAKLGSLNGERFESRQSSKTGARSQLRPLSHISMCPNWQYSLEQVHNDELAPPRQTLQETGLS